MILDEVKEILSEQLGISADKIELSSNLVEVPDETIENMKTVEDIVNFIENNID